MKNIVLCGLINDRNLGDPTIYLSTKYSVEKYLSEKHIKFKIKTLDMLWRKDSKYRKNNRIRMFYKKIKNKIYHDIIKKTHTEAYIEKRINSSTTAIIFCGGGLFMYTNLKELYQSIGKILKYAEKYNVPVMFSGIGVEEYSETSEECQKLKNSINKDCVKVITTRDNLEMLQKNYVRNLNKIKTLKVSDPVCSISKIYKKAKMQDNTIGLNIIRGTIFKEYGNNISEDEMLQFYSELYAKLSQKFKVKLFTNGTIPDQLFAKKIVEKLNLDKKVLIPRPKTVKQLIKTITSFQAIIGTRLHASIIAYSYNIPCIGLVWNVKQIFFGKCIGYPNRFFDIKNFDSDKILKELETAIKVGYKAIDINQ